MRHTSWDLLTEHKHEDWSKLRHLEFCETVLLTNSINQSCSRFVFWPKNSLMPVHCWQETQLYWKIVHQFRLCIKTYNFRPFIDLRLALYAELHYKSNHPSPYLLTFVMLKIPPWYYFISSKGLKSLTCLKNNCCMRWPKVINCELFIFTMPCTFWNQYAQLEHCHHCMKSKGNSKKVKPLPCSNRQKWVIVVSNYLHYKISVTIKLQRWLKSTY